MRPPTPWPTTTARARTHLWERRWLAKVVMMCLLGVDLKGFMDGEVFVLFAVAAAQRLNTDDDGG